MVGGGGEESARRMCYRVSIRLGIADTAMRRCDFPVSVLAQCLEVAVERNDRLVLLIAILAQFTRVHHLFRDEELYSWVRWRRT